jgi:CRISPR/Cas system CSM-associated protein Csm3 (group 7 of RAMP superfamily)
MAHGKIVLTGELELCSPALIGCGHDDVSDIDVLIDIDGKPFIPATSFIGILRHRIRGFKLTKRSFRQLKQALKQEQVSLEDVLTKWETLKDREYLTKHEFIKTIESTIGKEPTEQYQDIILEYTEFGDRFKCFWGFTSETSISEKELEKQSAICCSDLYCLNQPKIVIRDGIKIDALTGIVKEGAKYDYQIIEPGAKFKVYLEADYADQTESFVKQMMATIASVLQNGELQIGAKTNNGLGKAKLIRQVLYNFDFSNKKDVVSWLTQNFPAKEPLSIEQLGIPFDLKEHRFHLNAAFWLKNSLIVRSYSADPEKPDAVHIKSGGKSVLPGTSLKGAIRARAERIVNTLNKPASIITNLFGFVEEEEDEEKEAPKAKKGGIRIEEAVLPDFVSEMQTRIKIDRFTGGTIEAALFDTMPVFSFGRKLEYVEPEKIINLQIHVRDCQKHEAGLLLLVLKDLWTGDLAVGGEKNIGRGVFDGIQAIVEWNGEKIRIEEDFSKLSPDQKKTLQGYVDALNNYKEGDHV